jgi:spore coat protein U-like protein
MSDQGFTTPTAGQADWDASLNADLAILERGYNITERAGVAINTGNVLYLNSGGFFFPYDPNSLSILPSAMAFTAAASGDSLTALAWGIVRSLGINSPAVAGRQLFVSAKTPGLVVGSYGGADRPIGMGLTGYGVLFQPRALTPEILTSSLAIQAVTGSLHTFTLDVGKWGTNRQTVMIGNSADLVELKFYSDAARTTLLYSTKSGGVSVVGSYQDRAMWPYDNTDAVNSSAIYGTLKVMSAAAVGSDTISVRGFWDRVR